MGKDRIRPRSRACVLVAYLARWGAGGVAVAAACGLSVIAAPGCSQVWGPPANPGVVDSSPIGGGYPYQWAPNRSDESEHDRHR